MHFVAATATVFWTYLLNYPKRCRHIFKQLAAILIKRHQRFATTITYVVQFVVTMFTGKVCRLRIPAMMTIDSGRT